MRAGPPWPYINRTKSRSSSVVRNSARKEALYYWTGLKFAEQINGLLVMTATEEIQVSPLGVQNCCG
jgi:hypothetical protein